jgi:hypothetical protein
MQLEQKNISLMSRKGYVQPGENPSHRLFRGINIVLITIQIDQYNLNILVWFLKGYREY